jgi:hypothetical protein
MTAADYKLTAPSAVASIQESYDKQTLREIAEYGCSSGIAHDHIYYQQTYDVFIQFEDEIEDYFHDTLGDNWMDELGFMNSTSVRGYINQLVWTFIEAIANQLVD